MTRVTCSKSLGFAIAKKNAPGHVLVATKIEGREVGHCMWTKSEYGLLLAQHELAPGRKIQEMAGATEDAEVLASWGEPGASTEPEWQWTGWLGKAIGHRLWQSGV